MGPFTFNATAGIDLWFNAAIDLALSATLILALRRHVLGFSRATDSAIRRLMRTAATTASYTAVFAAAAAGLSVAWPSSSLTGASTFLAFSIPGSSLYALSMVATLGARQPVARKGWGAGARDGSAELGSRSRRMGSVQGGGAVGRTLSRQLSGMWRAAGSASNEQGRRRGGGGGAGPGGIQVRTEMEVAVDVELREGSHGVGVRDRLSRRREGVNPSALSPPAVAEPLAARGRRHSVQAAGCRDGGAT